MLSERSRPRWGSLLLLAVGLFGCGPGFAGYDHPGIAVDAGTPGAPWVGREQVMVTLGDAGKWVPLAGLSTSDLAGAPAVPLPEVVQAAGLTATPERYRYDFTATDGYNLLRKRESEDLLPDWSAMQLGVLYHHPDGDLRVAWDRELQPWGSALSAYQIKRMDGGTISLLEEQ